MKAVQASLSDLKTGIQKDWVDSLQRIDPATALRKRAIVAQLLKDYYDLSPAAKAEFTRQLNRLNSSDYAERKDALESIRDILNRVTSTQPEDPGCQMCGYKPAESTAAGESQ